MPTRHLRAAAIVAAIVAMFAAACSKGSAAPGTPTTTAAGPRPSSTGRVTIIEPKDGQVVRGSTVTVRVRLTGATIVPATTTHIVPDQGHLHLMVDGQIVSMNFSTKAALPVKPGTHTLVVEFVASDHGPFNPRDYAPPVQFTVKG
jgi:hypothetical protein